MSKELLQQRYEDLRQHMLAIGGYSPDEKLNLMGIMYNMRPSFKQALSPHLFKTLELIEDQKLYIEKLESALSEKTKK